MTAQTRDSKPDESFRRYFERQKARANKRLGTKKVDFYNDVSWHLLGGRRFFTPFWREIAGSHRWVFVIGCNNSGTSVLQRLLEWTGQISTFPLEGQLYTRAVTRDRDPRYSRVWTEYIQELQRLPGESLDKMPRLVHDWMINLPQPLQHVVVEKTPANACRARWLQEVFPDSRFIGLVRNGYAVTEGIKRKAGQPYARGARHWNAVNKLLIETSRQLDNYLEVRYDQLTDKPAGTMLEICRFIGINNSLIEEMSRGSEADAAQLMATKFGPVRNHDEATIAKLAPEDIATIKAEAGEMLTHFRY
jgi:hypothetical protein